MLAAFLIAHLWRRSGVLTDNELVELRYGGARASGLRLFRALYFGVLRNAIVLGWVNLAMLKVLELALGVDPETGRWILVGLFLLTVTYTLLGGFLGVVLTDLLQFTLAMAGSLLLAVLAVNSLGGLDALLERLAVALGPPAAARTVALIPAEREAFWAFVVYVAVKSWAAGNTEGSGYVAQRLLATRDERHARLAAIWFAVANFALRPWPWILVGLVATVSYPGLDDPEAGYVRVMIDLLPPGVLGLMVATLLAAFMSTVDTHLNWGASYLTHDVFERFVRPGASERTLVRVARASVVLLAALGALATLLMPSIADAWKFLASISAGMGLILLLRWLWWRINAWSEIAVMGSSIAAANALLLFGDVPFPFSLALVVAVSVPFALAVTLLTAPEPEPLLCRFYRAVRPRGWWAPVARRCGLPPQRLGAGPWLVVAAGVLGVYGVLLGAGSALLGSAWLGAGAAALGFVCIGAAVRAKLPGA
jgi:Na+/proline symporter